MNSKFKIFGGVGLIIGLLIFILIISTLSFMGLLKTGKNGESPTAFPIFALILGLGFLIYQALTRINILTISQNTITSKNIFTRVEQEYQIQDLDGFESKTEHTKAKSYELITLIKDDESVLKISSFYYSNFEEMKKMIQLKLKKL